MIRDSDTAGQADDDAGGAVRFHGPLAAELPAGWTDALLSPDIALPLNPASDRSVWGAVDASRIASIAERAERDRGTPWPQPLASQAARVHRSGEREGWEARAFARQGRLTRAAAMAATTLDGGWIDEVADGIVLLCEQSSWCWPAHDDAFARHGSVLPVVTDPYLDLGAGEVVAQLAWIDHLLGAQLDARYPGIRSRIRHEARARVIHPFLTRRDWHWIGLDGDVHNWNPWIHGNVMVAALRLLDEPGDADLRAEVVALAVEGLDRYVAVLPADGAIDEGYEYWWNGACRALEALDVLAHATSDVVQLGAAVPALRATVAFPHRMHLGGDWYLNLADGQAKPHEPKPWHALHRAAARAGDDDAGAHAIARVRAQTRAQAVAQDGAARAAGTEGSGEAPGAGRLLRELSDPDWPGTVPERSPLPATVWLPSIEVLLVRGRAGTSAGLTLAVKGGHNGEHHNHNDVGSFVVASDGVPVLVDAGRPTYTAQTFGPGRYDIWTMQSEWHNVPLVGDTGQPAGAELRATSVEADLADASLRLELATAYDEPALASLVRTARLDRTTGRIEIADSWAASSPLRIVEHLLVAGDVTLVADGARVRPREGATLVRLRWNPHLEARTEVRALDDPMLTSVWGASLTRISLDVTAGDRFTLTVERDDMIAEDDE